MLRQVFRPTIDEVVQDNHLVPILQQAVNQVTSDKSGASGD